MFFLFYPGKIVRVDRKEAKHKMRKRRSNKRERKYTRERESIFGSSLFVYKIHRKRERGGEMYVMLMIIVFGLKEKEHTKYTYIQLSTHTNI